MEFLLDSINLGL